MNILFDTIILPIETFVEIVFCFSYYRVGFLGVGGAIVAVSLAINFLALPLYNVADALQLKERDLQKKIGGLAAHIKKTFKGDEQFMILNTYYRQNNYHPLYVLRSSLSILIEIPFFIAAYHFLSYCSLLDGQSILFLKDLGAPDKLFSIGTFSINVLPIFMTAINIVSSAVYTKDAPLREKVQVYALALIFLVLLYNSPSGLVCYWILNNIFSLCKNLVSKAKNPKRLLYIIGGVLMILLSILTYIAFNGKTKTLIVYGVTVLYFILPPVLQWTKKRHHLLFEKEKNRKLSKENFTLLVFSCASLCLLAGFLLPSNAISTSPVEFSFIGKTDSPMVYIFSAFCFFFGIFILWPMCIYKMFGDNVKRILPPLLFILLLCSVANAFLFKYDYGTIDIFFTVENFETFTNYKTFFSLLPLLFMLCTTIFTFYAQIKDKIHFLTLISLVICITEFSVSIMNISKIMSSYKEYKQKIEASGKKERELVPEFNLSKEKQNVIVLLLDRAISDYFLYILKQFPSLNESYSGFVYYPNCLSFGESTQSASPALMGGYEYSPEELNKRDNEFLKNKHNESILVMPRIFEDAGYNVIFSDPPWMNYKSFFDPENLFDGFSNTKVVQVETKYGAKYILEHKEDFPILTSSDIACSIRIKHFSALQMLYPPLRGIYYRNGLYYLLPEKEGTNVGLDYYAELYYLPELTEFKSEKPTFSFIYNETAHEEEYMLKPDYRPGSLNDKSKIADISEYSNIKEAGLIRSYSVNAAAIQQTAKWLDFLKEKNCYDNTRIIIVSDHGRSYPLNKFSSFKKGYGQHVGYFNPLFLVKDFDATGDVTTDETLITNADTINFAIAGLGIDDFNPFTKKKLFKASDFNSFNVYEVYESGKRNAFDYLDCKTFPLDKKKGYNVRGDLSKEENWIPLK